MIAGFTATYLTEEKKIRYGIFEGLIILILTNLGTIISTFSIDLIIGSLIGIIVASIGGVIANKLDNTL